MLTPTLFGQHAPVRFKAAHAGCFAHAEEPRNAALLGELAARTSVLLQQPIDTPAMLGQHAPERFSAEHDGCFAHADAPRDASLL